MRLKAAALTAVGMVLLAAGCTQATISTPSIGSSTAAKTLADAAFDDANTAFLLAYAVAGTDTSNAGLSITGTSAAVGTVYTFDETVTTTDYDPAVNDGIFATGDVAMKGKYDTAGSGSGTYTYSGDLVMSGANGNGHVVLKLSLKKTATATQYTGTVTVKGTEYTYSGHF